MELSAVIQERKSIRKFKQEEVPENMVRELIEAGRLAPSGTNIQPTRYVIIKDAENREQLSECTPLPFVPAAPVVIACCFDKQAFQPGVNTRLDKLDDASLYAYFSLNAAIAIEHIILKAVDLGLGSCWVMMFDKDKVRKLIGLDERYELVALLPVGYPDQAPEAKPRLDLEQLILKEM